MKNKAEESQDKKPHRSDNTLDFLGYLKASQRMVFWKPVAKRIKVVKYVCLSDVSCDVDSVASTLALSYYRYRNKESIYDHYVPVLNMRRCDYGNKPELAYMLEKWNIYAKQHLLFRDDIRSDYFKEFKFITVNHRDSVFHRNVVEFFDYRPDRRDDLPLPEGCKRDLSLLPMRSCAGMITALYKRDSIECQVVYDLLRTALLVANVNFVKVPPQKLRDLRDLEMLHYLETYMLNKPMEMAERAQDYQKLIESMFDSKSLHMGKLLLRDFKVLRATDGDSSRRLVFTSFPMDITMLVTISRAMSAVHTFGREQGADFILLVSTTPGVAEDDTMAVGQLGLIDMDGLRDCTSCHLFNHMVINLNAFASPPLGLHPLTHIEFMHGSFFKLDKLDTSVQAMLRLVEHIAYHWTLT
ncbi:exopolyphosphatase PRUNE1-like [Drosophila guanche]|uniref:Uncharacterized protein n=1 Tax=Drosophila guanche TaxID=7266 RepID=A0A3B0KAW4_DROGU|nr:exopolyphosphatase PRUNE1-like [Drosophila guanche]SPP89862.1 Hypothetical predicted protein [Drosophila guanche]